MDPVSVYINEFPEEVVDRLNALRALVLTAVPDAVESMSYAMPAYKYKGKPLIYFAGYKHHVGVYATPEGQAQYKANLAQYKQGKGSVQFPNDRELPLELIQQMVLFNVSRIDEKLKK